MAIYTMVIYIIGVVFTAVGFYMLYDAYYFRKHARSYTGRVIGHKKLMHDRHYVYYPIAEYWDEQQRRHEFISDMNVQRQSDVGSSVEVLVLDNNHSTARIKLQGRLVLAYAFAVVGPIVLMIGLAMLDKDFLNSLLWAVIPTALLMYLTKTMVASSRKKRSTFVHPMFEDDTEEIHRSEIPPTSTNNLDEADRSYAQEVPQKRSYVRIFFATVFFMLSLTVFWFGLNKWHDVSVENDNRVKINGTVVEDNVQRKGGVDVHSFVVEFKPPDADTMRVKLNETASPSPSMMVGDSVTLAYKPGDYTSAKEYTTAEILRNFMILVLVVGGVLLGIAFILMPKRTS